MLSPFFFCSLFWKIKVHYVAERMGLLIDLGWSNLETPHISSLHSRVLLVYCEGDKGERLWSSFRVSCRCLVSVQALPSPKLGPIGGGKWMHFISTQLDWTNMNCVHGACSCHDEYTKIHKCCFLSKRSQRIWIVSGKGKISTGMLLKGGGT